MAFPQDSAELRDEAKLQVAVFHYHDLAITALTASPPPDRVVEVRDKAGQQVRRFRKWRGVPPCRRRRGRDDEGEGAA